MSLIQIAFVLLAAGAAGGLSFVALLALRVHYPSWFGIGHGLLGLVAVGVLAFALTQAAQGSVPPRAWWALGVFAMGLLGGVTLFRVLIPNRRPIPLALAHGSLAALGLYLLFPVAFP